MPAPLLEVHSYGLCLLLTMYEVIRSMPFQYVAVTRMLAMLLASMYIIKKACYPPLIPISDVLCSALSFTPGRVIRDEESSV